MSTAVTFPPPPRAVRFAAAFGRKAAVGVLGGVLLLAALLISAVQLWAGAGLPFEDWALDSESASSDAAVVERVAVRGRDDLVKITFRYRVGGIDYQQTSYADASAMVGTQHRVEFVPRHPDVSRLHGTSRAVPPPIPWRISVSAASIGVLALMLWLRFSVAQRRLLSEGRLVPGQVVGARRVAAVNPPQVAVEFTFRDAESRVRTGRQWCPANSRLGRALLAGERDVQVVHDRAHPQRCALAAREHFEPVHDAG
jgi:hypothetical protein